MFWNNKNQKEIKKRDWNVWILTADQKLDEYEDEKVLTNDWPCFPDNYYLIDDRLERPQRNESVGQLRLLVQQQGRTAEEIRRVSYDRLYDMRMPWNDEKFRVNYLTND